VALETLCQLVEGFRRMGVYSAIHQGASITGTQWASRTRARLREGVIHETLRGSVFGALLSMVGLAGAEAVVGRHRERRQAISLVRVVSSA
jgi:hypothetical protein